MRTSRYAVVPSSSAVLVAARSNMGSVEFGSTQLSGIIELVRSGEHVSIEVCPTVTLDVPLSSLTSGNALYDAELQTRLNVQRFPKVSIELVEAEFLTGLDYHVTGSVAIHGLTSTLHGIVTLSFPEPDTVLVLGDHTLDIRDFDIDVPSVLMLRIYPDVKVSLHLVAKLTNIPEGGD